MRLSSDGCVNLNPNSIVLTAILGEALEMILCEPQVSSQDRFFCSSHSGGIGYLTDLMLVVFSRVLDNVLARFTFLRDVSSLL